MVCPVLNWGLPLRNGVASAGLVPVGESFCTTTRTRKHRPLWACPRGTPVCPRIGHAPVCKPGFHRDKPGGEQFYVACEGSAETGFHRGQPGWELPWQFCSDWPEPPLLNLTLH